MKTKLLLLLFCFCCLGAWGQKSSVNRKCVTCGKPIAKCQYKGKHPSRKKTTKEQLDISDCNGYFKCLGDEIVLKYVDGEIIFTDLFIYRIWGSDGEYSGRGEYHDGTLTLTMDAEDQGFHYKAVLKHKAKGVFSGSCEYWRDNSDAEPYRVDNMKFTRHRKPSYYK